VVEFSLTPDETIIPHLGCCFIGLGTVKKLALSVGNGSYRSLLHKKRGEIAPLLSNFNLKVGVKVWINFCWKISTRITYNSTLTNHIVRYSHAYDRVKSILYLDDPKSNHQGHYISTIRNTSISVFWMNRLIRRSVMCENPGFSIPKLLPTFQSETVWISYET
jgi:hypothetical protein